MITLRRATQADLPAIVDMLAEDMLGVGREDTARPLARGYTDAFAAIDKDDNQLLAVAVLDDRVVGTMQITFLPGLSRTGAWRGQIEGVRVAAPHRGRGLGERMIAWALERCRERDCALVQLTTNRGRQDAHRFYDRLGFAPTHLGYKIALRPGVAD